MTISGERAGLHRRGRRDERDGGGVSISGGLACGAGGGRQGEHCEHGPAMPLHPTSRRALTPPPHQVLTLPAHGRLGALQPSRAQLAERPLDSATSPPWQPNHDVTSLHSPHMLSTPPSPRPLHHHATSSPLPSPDPSTMINSRSMSVSCRHLTSPPHSCPLHTQ